MAYKRILTIQDISCVGQCSMTVVLPVLSACGHEVCILPSAVLSTHTGGFQKPVVQDLTDRMPEMADHWAREGISFDLIYTGYLGSCRAIRNARQIMDTMLAPGGMIVADPAMADHGKLYRGLDEGYAAEMTALCKRADVVLPNVTEAARMAGLPYRENVDEIYIRQLLLGMDYKNVLLTGVGFSPEETGFALKSGEDVVFRHHKRLPRSYHGTGDLFAAAFVGALASGKSPICAGEIASAFTLKSIQNTYEAPAHWYGVKFETALPNLIEMLK